MLFITKAQIETADQLFEKEEYSKACKIYNELGGKISKKKYIKDYAHAKRQEGLCRLYLGIKEDREKNLKMAIVALNEAKKIYKAINITEYGKTLFHIGKANRFFSDIRNKEYHLNQAIEAYKEAQGILNATDFPNTYAMIQYSFGEIYGELSEMTHQKKNLKLALQAFEQILKFFDPNEKPLDYANTLKDIGNVYYRLSEISDKGINLKESFANYSKALEYLNLDNEKHVYSYAMIQAGLGCSYLGLSEINKDKKNNIRKALSAFNTALKIWKNHPFYYAMIKNDLGNAYMELSKIEKRKTNLNKAIEQYEEALGIFELPKWPQQHASTHDQLGEVYICLYQVDRKEEFLSKAEESLELASNFFRGKDYPLSFSETLIKLGHVYQELADFRDEEIYLHKAKKAFEDALEILNSQDQHKLANHLNLKIKTIKQKLK